MLFFFLVVLCWIPSSILLGVGLFLNKKRPARKALFRISFLVFLLPIVLAVLVRVDQYFDKRQFIGQFETTDTSAPGVHLDIKADQTFSLTVEACPMAQSEGNWQYDKAMEMLLLSAPPFDITIHKFGDEYIILNSDIQLECAHLKEIQLKKSGN